MAMVSEARGLYSVPSICAGLGIGRASFYRWQRPVPRAVCDRVGGKPGSAGRKRYRPVDDLAGTQRKTIRTVERGRAQ